MLALLRSNPLTSGLIACLALSLSAAGYYKWRVGALQDRIEAQQQEILAGVAAAERSVRESLQAQYNEQIARMRADQETLRGLADEYQRQKDAEKAAKWLARQELERLRSDPDVDGWLRSHPPAAIEPWLRGDSDSGKTDTGPDDPVRDPADTSRVVPDRAGHPVSIGWDAPGSWGDAVGEHGGAAHDEYPDAVDQAIHGKYREWCRDRPGEWVEVVYETVRYRFRCPFEPILTT